MSEEQLRQRIEKLRDSWATIRDKNRQLGWPEQADVVMFPRSFVEDLEYVLCACCADGRYTSSPRVTICQNCGHRFREHGTHDGK